MTVLAAVILMATTVAASPGASSTARYRVVPGQSPAVHVRVPYTFGTHDLFARSIVGEVKVSRDTLALSFGRLSLPIAVLEAGNSTLACHMREALGLDYQKSKFPEEHVCQNGRLPTSGNDAVVFREITFECTNFRFIDDARKLAGGAAARLEVSGRWKIHGVTRDDKVILTATPTAIPGTGAAALTLTGSATVHLPSYGILVKPALLIHAGDDATIDFNLLLVEQP